MKAQTHAVQQDVVRGVRWGVILVLALLLGIAGFRMLTSGTATAAPVAPKAVAATPAALSPAIKVASEPEVPTVTEPRPVPKPPVRRSQEPDVPEPPPLKAARAAANHFVPAMPVVKPLEKQVVVDGTLPDVGATQASADLPAVGTGELAPPPDKPGRTGKIVRSVGRVFGIGKKETQEK
jgi:hypothetical protein